MNSLYHQRGLFCCYSQEFNKDFIEELALSWVQKNEWQAGRVKSACEEPQLWQSLECLKNDKFKIAEICK